MPSGDLFMCVPDVQYSPPDGSRTSQSFEEIRILDYLRSYQLTGKPPPPCPAEPIGEAERAALALPPLFTPWRDTSSPPSIQSPLLQPNAHPHPQQQQQQILAPHPTLPALGTAQPQPAAQTRPAALPLTMEQVMRYKPEELPRVQAFTPVKSVTETFESIVCAPTFAWYSPEELRHFAYLHGLKHITASIPTPPLAEASDAPLTVRPAPTLIINEEVNETMDHICTHPAFLKHSPEELRLAFMRTRRQLDSQELMIA